LQCNDVIAAELWPVSTDVLAASTRGALVEILRYDVKRAARSAEAPRAQLVREFGLRRFDPIDLPVHDEF
jgi:hypothetical protein